jgi:putative oxidoreductase
MEKSYGEPQLVLPWLASFYERVIPLSWLIVRLAVGFTLMMHGWGKVTRMPGWIGAHDWDNVWYYAILLAIEFIGGISIMLGFWTRFWAPAAAIELLVITIIYVPNGYSWTARGFEYTLMWGLLCFAIALRGGGPYSLDRRIGKEL